MIAEAVSLTLLHSLWQATLLALLAALLAPRLARHSASARYLIYCATLLAVPVVALATFFWQLASLDGQTTGSWPVDGLADGLTGGLVGGSPSALSATVAPWLVGLWLAGVGFFTMRLLGGSLQVRRLRASTTPLPASRRAALQRSLARLRRAMGVHAQVALTESHAVSVPTLIGWLRPVILLPLGLATRLSIAELEAVIAHELGHVRRHDALINLLQSALEALFYFHPAVHWLSGRIREEREFCCDDLAVAAAGDAVSYALALTELEAHRGLTREPISTTHHAATATAIDPRGGPLMTRIHRLIEPTSQTARASSWLVPGFLALIVAGAALVSACEGEPEDVDEIQLQLGNDTQSIFIDENGVAHEVTGDNVWVPAQGSESVAGVLRPDESDVAGSSGTLRFEGADGAEGADGTVHRLPPEVARRLSEIRLQRAGETSQQAAFITDDGRVIELRKAASGALELAPGGDNESSPTTPQRQPRSR